MTLSPLGDVRGHLDAMVTQYVSELTSTHSVDEANGDVLDALIDHTVAQLVAGIEREAIERRVELTLDVDRAERRLRTLTQEVRLLSDQEALLEGGIRALRARITDSAPDSAGSGVNTAHLRTFIEHERTHWETVMRSALRTADVDSAGQLPTAADAAARELQLAEHELREAQARSADADALRDQALSRLRGTATDQGGSPT